MNLAKARKTNCSIIHEFTDPLFCSALFHTYVTAVLKNPVCAGSFECSGPRGVGDGKFGLFVIQGTLNSHIHRDVSRVVISLPVSSVCGGLYHFSVGPQFVVFLSPGPDQISLPK